MLLKFVTLAVLLDNGPSTEVRSLLLRAKIAGLERGSVLCPLSVKC